MRQPLAKCPIHTHEPDELRFPVCAHFSAQIHDLALLSLQANFGLVDGEHAASQLDLKLSCPLLEVRDFVPSARRWSYQFRNERVGVDDVKIERVCNPRRKLHRGLAHVQDRILREQVATELQGHVHGLIGALGQRDAEIADRERSLQELRDTTVQQEEAIAGLQAEVAYATAELGAYRQSKLVWIVRLYWSVRQRLF
jgi:hypothetical protein